MSYDRRRSGGAYQPHHRYKRVNEQDVPESRHTVFIRGLPASVTKEELQSFMEDRIGPMTYDMFKTKNDGREQRIVAACRFEDKNHAKECFDRYHSDGKILDHKVEVTWFRDIRRYLQQYDRNYNDRDRRNRYDDYSRERRRQSRSFSRSRSASRSRSRSRDYRSRSRSDSRHRRTASLSPAERSPQPSALVNTFAKKVEEELPRSIDSNDEINPVEPKGDYISPKREESFIENGSRPISSDAVDDAAPVEHEDEEHRHRKKSKKDKKKKKSKRSRSSSVEEEDSKRRRKMKDENDADILSKPHAYMESPRSEVPAQITPDLSTPKPEENSLLKQKASQILSSLDDLVGEQLFTASIQEHRRFLLESTIYNPSQEEKKKKKLTCGGKEQEQRMREAKANLLSPLLKARFNKKVKEIIQDCKEDMQSVASVTSMLIEADPDLHDGAKAAMRDVFVKMEEKGIQQIGGLVDELLSI
ncbi:hypothetical protein QR680_016854 [Steinernema hermaphroditum]|uniref:RRM domain-containing protein n=1 Tax=Steinernema hermaphroditum TaxID=289476 RepID=A0AA39HEM7_9BILA|nr:hypothetical protein QR680_016854 [Steinernema hermaphroditum]